MTILLTAMFTAAFIETIHMFVSEPKRKRRSHK